MNELQSNVEIISKMLKSALEECNLYIAVDQEKKQFLFFDRDDYHNGKGQIVRVNMEEINVRNK